MLIRVKRRARFIYLDENSGGQERPPTELAAFGPDPEGELACSQIRRVLRTEIRRIPPLLRNVMVLRDIEELPMVDVAERLGITVPAAKSRLLRARIELRSRLRRHCGRSGNLSLLSRSAAPLHYVAHHRVIQPLAPTGT
jgi:RNA polymerase sigma-70 factor (ECF subfamily)